MRRATGSEQLRLGKFRSLWNQVGAVSNLGFGVWVVYGILYALGHWMAAAVAGLAVMLAIIASENRTANVKIIDLTSLGFFVLALTMLLTVGDQVFNRYHIILVWGVFGKMEEAVNTVSKPKSGTHRTALLMWQGKDVRPWPLEQRRRRRCCDIGLISGARDSSTDVARKSCEVDPAQCSRERNWPDSARAIPVARLSGFSRTRICRRGSDLAKSSGIGFAQFCGLAPPAPFSGPCGTANPARAVVSRDSPRCRDAQRLDGGADGI
jgi:hypothetical protein